MKTVAKVSFLCSIILCLIVNIGCSNKMKADNAEAETNENSSGSTDRLGFAPVFIMVPREETKSEIRFRYPRLTLAFKNNKGEYITFDNDADYTDLCQYAELVYSVYLAWDRNAGYDENSWNSIVVPTLKEIPEHIWQYYNGDKKSIPTELFDIIDRNHYDSHPLEGEGYALSKSNYNRKDYYKYSETGGIWQTFIPLRDYHDYFLTGTEGFTLEGEKLPTNILVAL